MGRYIRIDKIIFNDSHWPTNDRKNGILISSNEFPSAVKYVVKGDSLIILSGNNGLLCFDLGIGLVFLKEIAEIVDCYNN
jgi:hypothetical protein